MDCMPYPAAELQYDPVPHPQIEYNGLLEYHRLSPQNEILGEKVITTVEYARPNFANMGAATAVSSRRVKQQSRSGRGNKMEKKIDYELSTDGELAYDETTKTNTEQDSNCGSSGAGSGGGASSNSNSNNCADQAGSTSSAAKEAAKNDAWMKGMMILHNTRIGTIMKRLSGQQETLDRMSKKIHEIGSKMSIMSGEDEEAAVRSSEKPPKEDVNEEQVAALVPSRKAKKENRGILKKTKFKMPHETAKGPAFERREGDGKDEKESENDGAGEKEIDVTSSESSDACSKCNQEKHVDKKINKRSSSGGGKSKMKNTRSEYEGSADDEFDRIFVQESE